MSIPNRGDTRTKLAQTDPFNREHPGIARISKAQQDATFALLEQGGEHAEQPDAWNHHPARRLLCVDRQVDDLGPRNGAEPLPGSFEGDPIMVEDHVDAVELARCDRMPAEIVETAQNEVAITHTRQHG